MYNVDPKKASFSFLFCLCSCPCPCLFAQAITARLADNDDRYQHADRMYAVISHHVRPDEIGSYQAKASQQKLNGPQHDGNVAGPPAQLISCFEGNIKSAMDCESHQCEDTDQDCVPIQNSRVRSGLEVGPQRLEKITLMVKRHTADDVAERGTEEYGEQCTGAEKTTSKKPCHTGLSMWARNSMPMARSISSHNTIMSGR